MGAPKPMKYIRQYSITWADEFTVIAKFLREHLPHGTLIHHVGSTSIPGMPAKDIIDVDIECPRGSINEIVSALAKAGYDHKGDQGIPTREAFSPRGCTEAVDLRSHHLYACETHSAELHRHLAFRDYLRAHPERAIWLADRKQDVDQNAATRDGYIQGKSASYAKIVTEAESWLARK